MRDSSARQGWEILVCSCWASFFSHSTLFSSSKHVLWGTYPRYQTSSAYSSKIESLFEDHILFLAWFPENVLLSRGLRVPAPPTEYSEPQNTFQNTPRTPSRNQDTKKYKNTKTPDFRTFFVFFSYLGSGRGFGAYFGMYFGAQGGFVFCRGRTNSQPEDLWVRISLEKVALRVESKWLQGISVEILRLLHGARNKQSSLTETLRNLENGGIGKGVFA